MVQQGIQGSEDMRTAPIPQAMRLIVDEAVEAKVRDILTRRSRNQRRYRF